MESSPSLRLSFSYDAYRRELYFYLNDFPLRFRCDEQERGYELVCLYCHWPLRVKQAVTRGPGHFTDMVTCSAHMWPLLDSCSYDKLEAVKLDRLISSHLTSDGFLSKATPRPFPTAAIESLAGKNWDPLELTLVLALVEEEVRVGSAEIWAAIHEAEAFTSWSARRLAKRRSRHWTTAVQRWTRSYTAALIQPS